MTDSDGFYTEDEGSNDIAIMRCELNNMVGLCEREDIFTEPFIIRNNMVKCVLTCTVNGNATDSDGAPYPIPIFDIYKRIQNAFYAPWTFTAMIVFSEDVSSTILIQEGGSMIVTGCNNDDVKGHIYHYRDLVRKALLEYKGGGEGVQYDCHISSMSLKNIMCTNKIAGKRIDLMSYIQHARRCKWFGKYEPEQINNACISAWHGVELGVGTVPRGSLEQITCTLWPAGGVNVMGFKTLDQLEMTKEFLERSLPPFLRDIPGFDAEEYKRKRALDLGGNKERVMARREAKIRLWRLREVIYDSLMLPYMWGIITDKKLARSVTANVLRTFSGGKKLKSLSELLTISSKAKKLPITWVLRTFNKVLLEQRRARKVNVFEYKRLRDFFQAHIDFLQQRVRDGGRGLFFDQGRGGQEQRGISCEDQGGGEEDTGVSRGQKRGRGEE